MNYVRLSKTKLSQKFCVFAPNHLKDDVILLHIQIGIKPHFDEKPYLISVFGKTMATLFYADTLEDYKNECGEIGLALGKDWTCHIFAKEQIDNSYVCIDRFILDFKPEKNKYTSLFKQTGIIKKKKFVRY